MAGSGTQEFIACLVSQDNGRCAIRFVVGSHRQGLVLVHPSALAYASLEWLRSFLLPEHLSNRKANELGSRPEWAVLLQCASPNFDAARLESAVRGQIDWQFLQTLADEHGVLPLLAARLRDVEESPVPSATRQQLCEWQRSQTVFTLSLAAELFRLLDHFATSHLEALLTKGPVLAARCYGDPGARQFTDLDLVVRDKDIRRATEIMIGLGYEAKVPLAAIDGGKSPGEYVFTQGGTGLLVEFHTERTFRYHPRPLPVERLFQRNAAVHFDGHDVPALSLEDELVLICIHGAKHFWTRLMWVADVAGLVSRREVDWSRATAVVGEVGAERMLNVGLLLAAGVLDTPLPEHVVRAIHADRAAVGIAEQIARRLPLGESVEFSLLSRAAFRVKMRGGAIRGAAYLLRLSLSPTEEDWTEGREEKRSWLLDAASRPFRLARKYGRDGRA